MLSSTLSLQVSLIWLIIIVQRKSTCSDSEYHFHLGFPFFCFRLFLKLFTLYHVYIVYPFVYLFHVRKLCCNWHSLSSPVLFFIRGDVLKLRNKDKSFSKPLKMCLPYKFLYTLLLRISSLSRYNIYPLPVREKSRLAHPARYPCLHDCACAIRLWVTGTLKGAEAQLPRHFASRQLDQSKCNIVSARVHEFAITYVTVSAINK